jgi:putative addiction module component (TIGR02574 family)
MTREALLPSILALTPEDRLSLIDDIWTSLPPHAKEWPLTDEQRAELDRRLEDAERNPDSGRSWEEVEAAVRARLSQD